MRKNLGGPERGADPIQHMTYVRRDSIIKIEK